MILKPLFVLFSLFLFSTSALSQSELTEIKLDKPLLLKNSELIEMGNNFIYSAVYWEDEGYEFKQLSDSDDLSIVSIFKNNKKETVKLVVQGTAPVGGFGWHEGYQEGTADCRFTFEKIDNEWAISKTASSDNCEVTLNTWD